jgi:hypothetical protein
MSTTIDAAIIKALVEHIGMDPDSVPTNQSSLRGTPIPVEWKVRDNNPGKVLSFTIPEGKQLKYYLPPGTRLFLNNNQTMFEGDYEGPSDLFIVNYESDDKGKCYGVCSDMETGCHIDRNDNEYVLSITEKDSGDLPLPDNKTTGFFIPNSPDALPTAIRALLTHIGFEVN